MKISVKKRELNGKKAKELLSDGFVPGAIYGPKRKSTNIELNLVEFEKIFDEARYSNLIEVEVEGEKQTGKALIREVQFDPVSDRIIHVSFYELDLEKPITAEIPVVTKGESKAIIEKVGFLVTPVETITVRCLPDKLPSELLVDISSLDAIGDSVPITDLKLPEGVEFATEVAETTTLAYVAPPQKEIVEEAPVEEGEGDVAEEGEEGEEGEEKSADEAEEDSE